jgi:biopolymer transport protein ExbD
MRFLLILVALVIFVVGSLALPYGIPNAAPVGTQTATKPKPKPKTTTQPPDDNPEHS